MPKISSVKDIKPKMSSVEDIKPKITKVSEETEVYYEDDTTLKVGQVIGLLLCLTYAEEHPNTTQIRI
jgi:hypothetical protein